METIFEVAEAGSGSQLSAVRMTTLVESMVSCENTRVFFSDEAQITAVEASRSIELVLEALDADMMPLRFTAVAISCSFGEKPCIVAARTPGKHLYAISVPSDFTRDAGTYDLVVSVIDGWNSSSGRQEQCVVLRHVVAVSAGLSSLLVIAISSGVALLSVLVVGALVKFKVS
jgi:hypothetical protein